MAATHTSIARDIIEEFGEITLHQLVHNMCLVIEKHDAINGDYVLELDITNDTYPKYSYDKKKRIYTYTEKAPVVEEYE